MANALGVVVALTLHLCGLASVSAPPVVRVVVVLDITSSLLCSAVLSWVLRRAYTARPTSRYIPCPEVVGARLASAASTQRRPLSASRGRRQCGLRVSPRLEDSDGGGLHEDAALLRLNDRAWRRPPRRRPPRRAVEDAAEALQRPVRVQTDLDLRAPASRGLPLNV